MEKWDGKPEIPHRNTSFWRELEEPNHIGLDTASKTIEEHGKQTHLTMIMYHLCL